jgi:lipid-A-disaccharide synthase
MGPATHQLERSVLNPTKNPAPKSVVMVAGEASGDLHGAHLMQALKKRHQDIFVCGAGGTAMKAAGVKIVVEADQLAVMGFTALFAKAPRILAAMAQLKKLLTSLKPDLLILIDFPDFNLHLAATAKKLRIPVLYYISPQIWAWRSGRIKKIKARIDHMAVILPFETTFYESHAVPASFVGHPLLDAIPEHPNRQAKVVDINCPIVALLPGSRECEVLRLLPPMLGAANILKTKLPGIRFVLSKAPSLNADLVADIVAQHDFKAVDIVEEPVAEIFARSCLSIITSGTATLEAAIHGAPFILTYITSPLNYWLAKTFVDVPHIGLANLIADKAIVPELIQESASADNIADCAHALLTNPVAYAKMRSDLLAVRQLLGQPGASHRVAHIACRLMGCNCTS